jgi:hypothetical protein
MIMKTVTAFIFGFCIVFSTTDNVVFAQGRGNGRGPAVTGSGPGVTQRVSDHGRVADHQNNRPAGEAKDAHQTGDVAERIEHNTALKARIETLLPPGMDLRTAASGFRNQGQFIAALHVSKNLNIPFTELKARMTGTNPESLGRAIHDLKPEISDKDANKAAEKAEREARNTEKTSS